jgi:hypothetical protein
MLKVILYGPQGDKAHLRTCTSRLVIVALLA